MRSMNTARKPLVVVVDIDDDVSEVLGRRVIVGYENVKDAVLEYGIRRPEDADVNAMFAGLQLYNELKEAGMDPEIAVVGGHPVDSLEAQRNIKEAVKGIVEDLGTPVEFYIVSDGEEEFIVSELLRDLGEIAGFRRVIVEQHLGIEGSYLLVLRYIRKAIDDPRYARYMVGLPGIGLLIIALMALFNMAYIAVELFGVLLGLAMIIRGFNLEEPLENQIRRLIAEIKETPHFNVVGLMMVAIFTITGLYASYQVYKEAGFQVELLVELFKTSIPLIGAGMISYILIAKVFYKASRGELEILRDVAAIIVIAAVSAGFYNLGVHISEVMGSGPIEEFPVTSFIESGFIQYVIIGTGIAALLELLRRIVAKEAS